MYYSEKFNSISHLVGAILSLMGLGALITVAIQQNTWQIYVSFTIFGSMLVLLYGVSTLYHSFSRPGLKTVFQKLDHLAIYLLIAGTYTPYALVSLYDSNGLLILGLEWGLAFIGIMLELNIKKRIEALQLSIYLIMGWLIVFDFSALQSNLAEQGVFWLIFGGIAYSLGIIFYILDDKKIMRHAHGIWHLFVLVGSGSHFISVIAFVR